MEGLLQCLDIKQLNLTVTQTLKNLTALNEEQDVKVIIHCCKTAVLPQIRVYRDCVKHIGRTIVADESFARNKEFLNNLFDFLCQVFLRVDTSFPIETSREMISVLCEIFVIVGNVCDRETAFLALDALMTLCIQPMNLCLKELKYKFTTNDSSPVVRDQHKPNLSVDVVCEIICCLCSEAKETCNVASYITNCLSHNNFQLVKRRLLDCLPTLNDRLIVKILIDVYPTCEVVDKIPIPYNDIWLTIMQYFKRNEMGDIEEKRSFVFVVLSCISDYLFPKMDVTSETLPIWINCRFWELLQCGLVHDNPLHRKRSIYFLKKVIEFLQNTSIEIPQSLCDGLFSWPREDQSRMAQKTFETICLILETTEEKQVHVIKPLLPVVSNLLSYTNENDQWFLHTSWILVIFKRLLKHDSKVIKRWTIEQICNMHFDCLPLFKQRQEQFFLRNFLEALNDISIYARNSNEPEVSSVPISCLLSRHYKSCYAALKPINKQAAYFQELLKSIRRQSWSAVPLLYVSYGLLSLPQSPLWNLDSITDLREMFVNTLRTHELILRSAIQEFMLEVFIKLVSLAELTFNHLSLILVIFKREECFQRKNRLYRHISLWLAEAVTGETQFPCNLNTGAAKDFLTKSCYSLIEDGDDSADESSITSESLEVTRIARMIILLCDCKVLSMDSDQNQYHIRHTLEPYIEILTTCYSRPYIPAGKVEKCLRLFLTLLIESKLMTNDSSDDVQTRLLDCFREFLPTFLPYVTKKFFSGTDHVYGYLELYFKFIEQVIMYASLHTVLRNFILDCCQKSRTLLTDLNQSGHFMKQYVAIKCFNMTLQFLEVSSTNCKDILQTYCMNDFLNICIKENFLSQVPQDVSDITFADRNHKENPKKLHSDYLTTLWSCIARLLNYKQFDSEEYFVIMNQAVQVQDIGSYESLEPVFRCLEHILPECGSIDAEATIKILQTCWKTLFEIKPCATFWTNVDAFIKMAFHPKLLNCDNLTEHLMKISLQLFERSETCNGLFIPLVRRITAIWMNPEYYSSITKCMPLLVQALTFGHVHRKDQRITQDAVTFVSSLNVHVMSTGLWERYNNCDVEARVRSVILLLDLQSNNYLNEILPLLITHLIDYEKMITKSKPRHFANSLIHRVKQRVWQILLLLTHSYDKVTAEKVLKITFERLIDESLQPSVRHLLEWLSVRLLYAHTSLHDILWTTVQKAAESRVGSLGSFLSIIYHLANISTPLHLLEFIQKAIPVILPWCTAQHFNTRIYAQVALCKLWDSCKDNNFHQVLDIYSPLENLFLTNTEHCGTSKGVKKLLEDYNFLVFHHLNHFTIETIFYELPRLCNVTEDEWIHPKMFEKYNCFLNTNEYFIPLYNSDNKLSSSQPWTWIAKFPVKGSELESEDNKNFQRKLTPWKNKIPEYEDLGLVSSTKKVNREDKLVVVASLIDRAPNLGGLCRTCEVFGVTQYVVGSLQYTEDKQFQSLSVSADRWVQIKEVKPHELNEYLRTMKKSGYTVIGAEQTANSVRLDTFNFPRKSLLLLGNEKEGIPVELIQLLDVCVEIPQMGFIRSLNVHVTGAILIWEYTRQRQKLMTSNQDKTGFS